MGFQKGNDAASTTKGAKAFILALRKRFEDNMELIMNAIDNEIADDPLKAYEKYYFPTIPKNIELSGDNDNPLTVILRSHTK
jgi:hypothetical protein